MVSKYGVMRGETNNGEVPAAQNTKPIKAYISLSTKTTEDNLLLLRVGFQIREVIYLSTKQVFTSDELSRSYWIEMAAGDDDPRAANPKRKEVTHILSKSQ